ncbi:MAG: cob(I)yrinic acid a,c-diamide adenosyltransferase, partial [Thermodesulfobacteriota bacterium]
DSAPSGEKSFFADFAQERVTVLRSNCRHPFFTGDNTDEKAVSEAISKTFESVREAVAEGGVDLLVLDEIMAVLKGGWVKLDDFIDFIESRPLGLEVALTGRDAPSELVRISDYVTEMLKIKHPFDEGIGARKGFDY